MVLDNGKFDLRAKDNYHFLESGRNILSTKSNNKAAYFILLLLISLAVTFGLALYTFLKVQTLQNEVHSLSKIVDKLNYRFVDDDLFDDIKKFEKEDIYSNDQAIPSAWLLNDDDSDMDFDYSHEDENGTVDPSKAIVFPEVVGDDGEGAPKILLKGGNYTKEGLERLRHKRDVMAATVDGVLINSESYADMKKKNKTIKNSRLYNLGVRGGDGVHSPVPKLESGYSSPDWLNSRSSSAGLKHFLDVDTKAQTPAPNPILSRSSRVMHLEDKSKAFRRVIKKPVLKSGDRTENRNYQEQVAGPEVVVRGDHVRRNRHRQRLETMDERHIRIGRIKPLPTIHFSGDTTKYVVGQHTNYNGNGHLRHPDKTFVDWKLNDWVKSLGMDQHYQSNNGIVTIKETGLYFIYAQIYYLDEHDTNGYRVYKNQETLLQCTTMTHSSGRVIKGNTCYTAAADYLTEGDHISVRDLSDGRYSLFEPGKSFFGMFKIGDVKIK